MLHFLSHCGYMTQTLTERADNVSRPVLIFSAVKLMENDDEQSHTKGPGINLSSPVNDDNASSLYAKAKSTSLLCNIVVISLMEVDCVSISFIPGYSFEKRTMLSASMGHRL